MLDFVKYVEERPDHTALFSNPPGFSFFSRNQDPQRRLPGPQPDPGLARASPSRCATRTSSRSGAASSPSRALRRYVEFWGSFVREYLALKELGLAPGLLRYELLRDDAKVLGLEALLPRLEAQPQQGRERRGGRVHPELADRDFRQVYPSLGRVTAYYDPARRATTGLGVPEGGGRERARAARVRLRGARRRRRLGTGDGEAGSTRRRAPDSRLRVVHQQNAGVGAARANGVAAAKHARVLDPRQRRRAARRRPRARRRPLRWRSPTATSSTATTTSSCPTASVEATRYPEFPSNARAAARDAAAAARPLQALGDDLPRDVALALGGYDTEDRHQDRRRLLPSLRRRRARACATCRADRPSRSGLTTSR